MASGLNNPTGPGADEPTVLDFDMAEEGTLGMMLDGNESRIPLHSGLPFSPSTPAEGAAPFPGTRFRSPMDDDALFSMFIDDNAVLDGPSFLASVHDGDGNAPLPTSPSAMLIERDTPPIEFSDSLPPRALIPLAMGDNTLQDINTMPFAGNVLSPGPPLDTRDPINNPQLHVTGAADLSNPLWPGDGQEFIFHPPPPFQLEGTLAPPHGQADLAGGLHESFVPTSTRPGDLDPLGLPTPQPASVIPGQSQHPFPGTIPPLNQFGSPQAPIQDQVMGQHRLLHAPKRPYDQPRSPGQPAKRHCAIQPKPLPGWPKPAGNTPTVPNPPPKSSVKEGNVPSNMLTTLELTNPGITNAADKRTRSNKVCLKCQTLRKKVSHLTC